MSTQHSVSLASKTSVQTSVTSVSTSVPYKIALPVSNKLQLKPQSVSHTYNLERKQQIDVNKPISNKERFLPKKTFTKVDGERLYLYSAFSVPVEAYINSNISAFSAKRIKGKSGNTIIIEHFFKLNVFILLRFIDNLKIF